jgi:pimeloyl-ACP methyl ester carboxylesterase
MGGRFAQRADGLWPSFDRDVLVRMLAAHEGRSYWREWAAVACPVLVVLAQSSILAAGDVEAMLGKPDVLAASVPDSGHDVHLERPEAIRLLVNEFLTAVTRGNDS